MGKTSEFDVALDWVRQVAADGLMRFSEVRYSKTPDGMWRCSVTSHNGKHRKPFSHVAESREEAFVGLTLAVYSFWKPRGVQLPLMLFQIDNETEG